jgi:hypothetical protein
MSCWKNDGGTRSSIINQISDGSWGTGLASIALFGPAGDVYGSSLCSRKIKMDESFLGEHG